MFASNTFEVWTMFFFLLIGGGFILFSKKGEMVFAGLIALGGITSIAFSNHSQYLEEQFTLKRFNEGSSLVCGLWRGESVRVNLSNGWKKEEGVGFIKGDMIINDISVCNVIGEQAPEPSSVPYWMALVSVIGVLLMLRAAIMGKLERVAKEEDHDADDDTNCEPS